MMAREAGAKKVYFASCAPPIRYPNVYGIDMPTRSELVAYNRNEDEIAEEIGADKVIYEDLHDLTESVRRFNPSIETFDTSVFDGKYITGDVDESYFNYIEGERNDDDKTISTDNESIGLHNSFRKQRLRVYNKIHYNTCNSYNKHIPFFNPIDSWQH